MTANPPSNDAQLAQPSSQTPDRAQYFKSATPPSAGSFTPNITEKVAQATAKGEYIDYTDSRLSTLSVPSAASVAFTNPSVLPAQNESSLASVIRGPRKRHIDSFDTWLQAWNVYEKLVMASQPSR